MIEYVFIFYHIISRFNIPREIVSDHGSHFKNCMMEELASWLGFYPDYSLSCYPQVNHKSSSLKMLKICFGGQLTRTNPIGILCFFPPFWLIKPWLTLSLPSHPSSWFMVLRKSYRLNVIFDPLTNHQTYSQHLSIRGMFLLPPSFTRIL